MVRSGSGWALKEATLCLCLFVCAVLGAGPGIASLAHFEHLFERTIGTAGTNPGQLENPTAVAVNDTSGDIYVADKTNNRVERFSSTGAFISQFNGSEAPKAFSEPDGVAIDNSGKTPLEDPSVQDIYVYDSGNKVIDKLDPSGKYLGQITEAEAGQTFAGGLDGIATDQNGLLWVYQSSGEIDSFSNAASNKFLSKRSSPFGTARGFAVGSNDDLFTVRGDETIAKLNTAGEPQIDRFFANEASTAVAADLSSGQAYLYNNLAGIDTIAAFAPASSCTAVAPCAEAPKESLLERFGNEHGAKHLSEGRGLAVNAANRIVYAAASFAKQVVAFGAILVPDVASEAATNLTPSSAQLNGSVNPDGVALTDCHFEYGETEAYGHSIPCEPSAAEIGAANAPVAVHATLSGLSPASTVHFRLLASNANNVSPSQGADQQFIVPGPGLRSASVTEVTSESVVFHARIDPNNAPTSYYFQYGPSSEYGHVAPVSPAFLGEGSAELETAPQTVTTLSAGTLYHYRLVALSELSPGHSQLFPGPDQTFQTNAASGAQPLVDGRQWELVSPVNKHGVLLEPIAEAGLIQASASGDAISYLANGTTETQPEGNSNRVQILARRLSGGWQSKDIATPHTAATGASIGGGWEYRFFSSDLTEAFVQPLGDFLALSPAASEQTPYLRSDFAPGDVAAPCEPSESDCYRPLVSGCPASGPCAKAIEEAADVPAGTVFANNRKDSLCTGGPHTPGSSCRPLFVAANPSASAAVLESAVDLTPAVSGASGHDLYEWSGGRLSRVGALVGVGEEDFHAISNDGSKIVFDGKSEGLTGLLLRDTARGKTLQLDAKQASCGPCVSGGGEFRLAAPDGSRVYFTDQNKLTANAGAQAGEPDLYECQVIEGAAGPECALSDITPAGPKGEAANARGVLGASEDGSYLYYATGAPSAPRIYVRHGGATSLIGALAKNDASDWAEPRHHTARVSQNGQWLAFLSQEPLTGYDTRDALTGKADMEVYLYDAASNRLSCASCNPSGARPVGIEYRKTIWDTPGFPLSGGDRLLVSLEQGVAAIVPGGTPISRILSLYQSRYLSNSGRLFFNSHDALVPQDVNNTMDVYEFEPPGVGSCTGESTSFHAVSGGCVSLISAGTSPLESAFLDASETGGDVFFLTASKLAPQDTDSEVDVYDAHECSAEAPCFPTPPVPPPPCTTGESCKPAPTPQPEIFGAVPSETFSGIGNPPPPALPPTPAPKPPTRAQLLAKALKACQKKPKAKRKGCEAAARKRYGTKAKRSTTRKKGR